MTQLLARTADFVKNASNGGQLPTSFGSLSKPFSFRAPAVLEFQILNADDDATFLLNGQTFLNWRANHQAPVKVTLPPGHSKIRLRVFNQRSFRGGLRRIPEGWRVDVIVKCNAQEFLRHGDGEDRPAKDGPRFGHEFDVLEFDVHVDRVTGTISRTAPKRLW